MAVRTDIAGVKRKRKVSVDAAQPNPGTPRSRRKTLPRDEAAALRADLNRARAKPGPAAKKRVPKSGRVQTSLRGRKKAPSEIAVKHRGGPRKRLRIHGG
jgi:hypothetical protein